MDNRINKTNYILFILICLLFASCRSSKNLYNPKEVKELSNKLGIEISNDDKNIPLYAEASTWIGVKYRYGGTSRSGIDCSGLTNQIYLKVYGKKLERSSDGIADKNVKKKSKSKLKPGDLVFFATTSDKKKISHVGIVLKHNRFIHSSTSRGVIVSSLDEEYYKKRFKKAGEVK